MKPGDLRDIVIGELNTQIGLSIKEITKNVNEKSDKEYAYTTISTVLSRLETQKIIEARKAKINGRKINLYYLSEQGFKKEVQKQLQNVILKFGVGGVKHLGELLDTEIDEKDLESIQKRLDVKN
ncbi:MAG: BlaI/MecI/CopY family transcriptional regulator [Candidatus Heimdallarchaeota archaeon]|nr:BlaI/MecI/CopY family transcriptional regulator [Candidatus Heimdallarchaeota archaeon]